MAAELEIVEQAGIGICKTSSAGTQEVPLGFVQCSQVRICNYTDTELNVRYGSRTAPSGANFPVPTGMHVIFRGLTNAKELWIRRSDSSTEQVEFKFVYEGVKGEFFEEEDFQIRTTPFSDVLFFAASKRGYDPLDNIPPAEMEALVRYLNFHVRRAWEMQPWPEWTHIEERYYRKEYDDDTEYGINAQVRWGDPVEYYQKITNAGAGTDPTDTTAWLKLEGTNWNRYVSLDQEGQTPIGTVLRMTEVDPRLTDHAKNLDYWFSRHGIQMPRRAGKTVWIQFRERPPKFTAKVWYDDEAYTAGTRVYWSDVGDCYIALVDTEAGDLPSDTTKFELIPFPYVLAPYVKRAIEAESLEEDGQDAKAALRRADADDLLGDEWEKVEGQQGQERRFVVNVRRRV